MPGGNFIPRSVAGEAELVASPAENMGTRLTILDDIVIRINYALDPPLEIWVLLPRVLTVWFYFYFAAIISIHISSFPKPDNLQAISFEWSIIEVNGIDYCKRVSPPYWAQFGKRTAWWLQMCTCQRRVTKSFINLFVTSQTCLLFLCVSEAVDPDKMFPNQQSDSGVSGPVHTKTIVNANFFMRLVLPSTRRRWKRSP